MRPDSNCGLDGYLCLRARALVYLRCSYVRSVASPRRHHIFEDRSCGWNPCYTSRVDCSLHPIAQLRVRRLIYAHNCRTSPSLKLDGQLTSQYERVRKTLDDSSSLKPSDIIHFSTYLRPIPAAGLTAWESSKWGLNSCQACGHNSGRKVQRSC